MHNSKALDAKESNHCEAIMLHEGGRWLHHYFSPYNQSLFNNASSLIRKTFLPTEIDWLAQEKVQYSSWNECLPPNERERHGIMYKSKLGNQCGCAIKEFKPSLSMWLPAVSTISGSQSPPRANIHHDTNTNATASPSIRLIQRLAKANQTLCFAGDSIDFQFYDALRNNLNRQKSLQNQINVTVGSNRQIPVNYTNETGRPQYTGFMSMNIIEETVVSLEYNNTDHNYAGQTHTSVFRYFKTYGWSPWNTVFMQDCNVVILNLGLHYDARNEGMLGTHWGRPKLMDDFRAAITYLVDFVASGENRTAVWRLVFYLLCLLVGHSFPSLI
mmetsp:Transcript_30025/g.63668  ORF Transcript_30025/g.63668 Transcript_30025/m.63668 type:complete len:329 (+) Transcript_30025:255-1241(+)